MGDQPILHLSLPTSDRDEARHFYVDILGCRPSRVRDDWFDVWFFGMQLTLKRRPSEVRAPDQQGVTHFGVMLRNNKAFEGVVGRVSAASVAWMSPPTVHAHPGLSGKTGGKSADQSGDVIEVKYSENAAELLAQRTLGRLVSAIPIWLTGGMSTGADDQVELTAVLWVAPEGGYCALNPETGTASQGDTEAEALANLVEATELYLEEFPLPTGQRPVITTFRIADVA